LNRESNFTLAREGHSAASQMLGNAKAYFEAVKKKITLMWTVPDWTGILQRKVFNREACTAR
jgi:hypothetical protein